MRLTTPFVWRTLEQYLQPLLSRHWSDWDNRRLQGKLRVGKLFCPSFVVGTGHRCEQKCQFFQQLGLSLWNVKSRVDAATVT